ncbi:MAG: PA0069 family radical SAM protein [Pseudobdellovibrionaceae bacterium]
MSKPQAPLLRTTGRGSLSNHEGRFEKIQHTSDLSDYGYMDPEESSLLATQFFKDTTRKIINHNDSPDIPFNFSINPYRGCEHGCIYCYARPTHEYLGFSAGLDFESKIFIKEDAPELLRQELMKKSWKGELIGISGVTDCYQPAERKFEITRLCLEVLAEFRNPVVIITKNQLVRRDIDVLKKLAAFDCVLVCLSVTSLDLGLARILEPRTSSPQARMQAIRELSAAGIPVSVNISPVIPGLTDNEMPAILKTVSEAGAISASYTPVRLPHSVSELFTEWLAHHMPDRKDKVLSLIKQMRGGKLNDPNFGSRMQGEGPIAEQINQVFEIFSRKYQLDSSRQKSRRILLSSEHFVRPEEPKAQLSFF